MVQLCRLSNQCYKKTIIYHIYSIVSLESILSFEIFLRKKYIIQTMHET